MKLYRILPALVVLILILTSCKGVDNNAGRPWRGYWYANISNPDGDGGHRMYVRLDFYDSTVCADGFENALGVLSIAKDRSVYTPVTADLVTSAEILNDTEARITYVQQSSGQLWSGTVRRNPATGALTFRNGKMLRPGPSGADEPADLPYEVNPTKIEFDKISDKPNHKDIPSYELIMALPDRSYYLHCLAEESQAPPFGDVQLRCYFPETDRDINITNEIGESPLDARFRSTIIDCWQLPDEPGLGLIVWAADERMQEFTLYRIGNKNTFEAVDYIIGRRPDRYRGEHIPDSAEICSMYRDGRKVKVYDPSTRENRVYNLSARRQ